MMKFLRIAPILAMTCLLFSACKSKQSPINELTQLTEEVQANGSSYTQEDWEATAIEMEKIEAEFEQYKGEYTDEELNEIGRLKGVYAGQCAKYAIKGLKDDFENAAKQAEGFIEGLTNSLSEE